MKRIVILLVVSLVLLAVPFSLRAYDFSKSNLRVLPECIWSTATGGGTWKTEIQIIGMSADDATLNVYFYYAGGHRGPFVLTTDLSNSHAYRSSNILSTIDGLDGGDFTYFGRVGAVWLTTSHLAEKFIATAITVNGNYGKSFPSLNVSAATTAALNRPMIIPNIVQSTTYRTVIGVFNTGGIPITAQFIICNPYTGIAYGSFVHAIEGGGYYAVNPFTEAGLIPTYTNTFLYILPIIGENATAGLMPFGAITNNTTNDPTALLAMPVN